MASGFGVGSPSPKAQAQESKPKPKPTGTGPRARTSTTHNAHKRAPGENHANSHAERERTRALRRVAALISESLCPRYHFFHHHVCELDAEVCSHADPVQTLGAEMTDDPPRRRRDYRIVVLGAGM